MEEKPGPRQSDLAFLDPLPSCFPFVVKLNNLLGSPIQIRHDKTDSGKQFGKMPFHFLVFHAASQPLNKDVVDPPIFSIHADGDAVRDQHRPERLTGLQETAQRAESCRRTRLTYGAVVSACADV